MHSPVVDITVLLNILEMPTSTLEERQAAFAILRTEAEKAISVDESLKNIFLFWNPIILTESLMHKSKKIQDWALLAILEINAETSKISEYKMTQKKAPLTLTESVEKRVVAISGGLKKAGEPILGTKEDYEAFFEALNMIIQGRPDRIDAVVGACLHLLACPILIRMTSKTRDFFAPLRFTLTLLEKAPGLPIKTQENIGVWLVGAGQILMRQNPLGQVQGSLPGPCVSLLSYPSLQSSVLLFLEKAIKPSSSSDKRTFLQNLLSANFMKKAVKILKDQVHIPTLSQDVLDVFKKIFIKCISFSPLHNKDSYGWNLKHQFYQSLDELNAKDKKIITNLLIDQPGYLGIGVSLGIPYFSRHYFESTASLTEARLLEVYNRDEKTFLDIFFRKQEESVHLNLDYVSEGARINVEGTQEIVYKNYFEFFCRRGSPEMRERYRHGYQYKERDYVYARQNPAWRVWESFFNFAQLSQMLEVLEETPDATLMDFLSTPLPGYEESEILLEEFVPSNLEIWSKDYGIIQVFIQSPFLLKRLFVTQNLEYRPEMMTRGLDGKTPLENFMSIPGMLELIQPYLSEHPQLNRGYFPFLIKQDLPDYSSLLSAFSLDSDEEFAIWDQICMDPANKEPIINFIRSFLPLEVSLLEPMSEELQNKCREKLMQFLSHLVQYKEFAPLFAEKEVVDRIIISTSRLVPKKFNAWVAFKVGEKYSFYNPGQKEREHAVFALAELVASGVVMIGAEAIETDKTTEVERVAYQLDKTLEYYPIHCVQIEKRLMQLIGVFDLEPIIQKMRVYQADILHYVSGEAAMDIDDMRKLSEGCGDFADNERAKPLFVSFKWVQSMTLLFKHLLLEKWQQATEEPSMKKRKSDVDEAQSGFSPFLSIIVNLLFALAKFARISSEHDEDFFSILPAFDLFQERRRIEDSDDLVEALALMAIIIEALEARHGQRMGEWKKERAKKGLDVAVQPTDFSQLIKEKYYLVEKASSPLPLPPCPLEEAQPFKLIMQPSPANPFRGIFPSPFSEGEVEISGGAPSYVFYDPLAGLGNFDYLDAPWVPIRDLEDLRAQMTAWLHVEYEMANPNGNCQFLALSAQLKFTLSDGEYNGLLLDLPVGAVMPDKCRTDEDKLAFILRQKAVNYIENHLTKFNGFQVNQAYLQRMRLQGEFGDHCTLVALSEVLNRPIISLSPSVLAAPESLMHNVFLPQDHHAVDLNQALILLFTGEDFGVHYDSVRRPLSAQFIGWFNDHYLPVPFAAEAFELEEAAPF